MSGNNRVDALRVAEPEERNPMSILWIILIVLLVLVVFGGFRFSRR
jgi:hypothetical protein